MEEEGKESKAGDPEFKELPVAALPHLENAAPAAPEIEPAKKTDAPQEVSRPADGWNPQDFTEPIKKEQKASWILVAKIFAFFQFGEPLNGRFKPWVYYIIYMVVIAYNFPCVIDEIKDSGYVKLWVPGLILYLMIQPKKNFLMIIEYMLISFPLTFMITAVLLGNAMRKQTLFSGTWEYQKIDSYDASLRESIISGFSGRVSFDFICHKLYYATWRKVLYAGVALRDWVIWPLRPKLKTHTAQSIYELVSDTSLVFSLSRKSEHVDELNIGVFSSIERPPYCIELHKDTKTAKVMLFNKEVAPNDKDLQECLSLAVPMYSHSFVHFHLPAVVCLYSDYLQNHSVATRTSVIGKLLYRHTRFNLVYNFLGHRGVDSTSYAFGTFPRGLSTTPEQFLKVNIARTQEFYRWKKFTPDGISTLGTLAECDSRGAKNYQYHAPPDFNQFPDYDFTKLMRQYYEAIEKYVDSFNIPQGDIDALADFIHACIPELKQFTKSNVALLHTAIWQMTALHSLDHFSFYQWRDYAVYAHPEDPWYQVTGRFFSDVYVQPYGSITTNEKFEKVCPQIRGLKWKDHVYNSISF